MTPHQEDPDPPDGPHPRQMGGGGGESGGPVAAALALVAASIGGYS